MSERISDEVISNCHQCEKPADTHANCKNQACHILFIQCDKCCEKFLGCCSDDCKKISILPIEEQRLLRKKLSIKANPYSTFKKRVRPRLKK